MQISHSIPSHDCFMIMQPFRGGYTSRCYLANKTEGELYELKDIDTGITQQSILLDYYVYTIAELPDGICYITYGLSAQDVKRALLNRYRELSSESKIEVLILKKK